MKMPIFAVGLFWPSETHSVPRNREKREIMASSDTWRGAKRVGRAGG